MSQNKLQYWNPSQFQTSTELEKFVTELCASLAVIDDEWKRRLAALQSLERMSTDALDPEHNALRMMMMKAFVKNHIVFTVFVCLETQIKDARSEITKQCAHSVVALANVLGTKFKRIAIKIFPEFMKGVGRSNQLIRGHANEAVLAILKHVASNEFLDKIMEIFHETKNQEIQKHCSRYFHWIMQKWSIPKMMKKEEDKQKLEKFLMKSLDNKCMEIRESARNTYPYFREHFPDRHEDFMAQLDKRTRKSMIQHKNGQMLVPITPEWSQRTKSHSMVGVSTKNDALKLLKRPKIQQKAASHSPRGASGQQKSRTSIRKTTVSVQRLSESKSVSPTPQISVSPLTKMSRSIFGRKQSTVDDEAVEWKKKAQSLQRKISDLRLTVDQMSRQREQDDKEWEKKEKLLLQRIKKRDQEIEELRRRNVQSINTAKTIKRDSVPLEILEEKEREIDALKEMVENAQEDAMKWKKKVQLLRKKMDKKEQGIGGEKRQKTRPSASAGRRKVPSSKENRNQTDNKVEVLRNLLRRIEGVRGFQKKQELKRSC